MSADLDRDTRVVTGTLNTAVAASGLSQAASAQALGTSAPRLSTYLRGTTRPSAHFLLRAHRIGQALGGAAARGLTSAPDTAAAMRRHLPGDDPEWVWRMLLQGRDHLALMLEEQVHGLDSVVEAPCPWPSPVTADSWEAAPGSTGLDTWDTLLAALTRHRFELSGVDAPAWARRGPLPSPWSLEHPFLSPDRVEARTPDWLRGYDIFIAERDLVTA